MLYCDIITSGNSEIGGMMFTGAGGIIAIIVILVVCAIVFVIGIRKEMN
jgi:hypothetical protein